MVAVESTKTAQSQHVFPLVTTALQTPRLVPSKIAATEKAAMRTRTIAAAMMLIGVTAAEGHSWYPRDRCHDNDCKPVPCGELIEMRHGLMWRGVVVFNETQVKPSRDQFCHVCVKEQIDMVPYVPLCVFVPPTS